MLRKKYIFRGLYQKTKQCLIKTYFGPRKIIFFTQVTKNVILSRKFVCKHRISVCSPRIFVLIFLTYWNVFFGQWVYLHLWAEVAFPMGVALSITIYIYQLIKTILNHHLWSMEIKHPLWRWLRRWTWWGDYSYRGYGMWWKLLYVKEPIHQHRATN